ncbi:hypothetical protein BC828DRAFT_384058 [Blastocladiella britannica]|nr:hypothetical protein BC828DRAFT_384058 [Blastocladiella britannica]
MTPTKDNQYALFFGKLRPTMAAMRDLASEQAETEGALPEWLDQTPALYERSAMYKRLGKWDWNRMAKYAPASFANMHAMFAQTIELAAALEGGINEFKWAKFEAAVRGFEKHVSEWTPELAEPLISALDAALVWHGDGSLLGDVARAKHFEFTANRPFPRVAVMKHTSNRPNNAIVGGKIGDQTLYLTSTMFHDKRNESYGYASYTSDIDGEISCVSCAPGDATEFSWLVKPATHKYRSTIDYPAAYILSWEKQRMVHAPHPLAGVVNVEWSASPVFIGRYKRDEDTILPGYLYIEDGVLHFVCAIVTDNDKRLIMSTQNAKGLWFPDNTKDVTFELLDRDQDGIEILTSYPTQFPFYKSILFAALEDGELIGRTPVVIRETASTTPIYLAWCLGKSGVYLGTRAEGSEVANYLEPGLAEGKPIPAKTSAFFVFTGQWREWFVGNWSVPHPQLEWRQASRANTGSSMTVQFATSVGMVTVARSKSKNKVGLDLLPPSATSTAYLLAHRPERDASAQAQASLVLDDASAEGNLGLLQWWKDADLPLEYTTDSVDKASAAGLVGVLQFWKDLGAPLRFTPAAIEQAARAGHLSVLEFFRTHLHESEFREKAKRCMGDASVRDWFAGHGIDIPAAVAATHTDGRISQDMTDSAPIALKAEEDQAAALKYRIDAQCSSGNVVALAAWIKSGGDNNYSEAALDLASANGHTEIVLMWFKSGLPLRYTSHAIDWASANGHVAVLRAWKASGQGMVYTTKALDAASAAGHTDILQWWMLSGLEMRYTKASVDLSSGGGFISILVVGELGPAVPVL